LWTIYFNLFKVCKATILSDLLLIGIEVDIIFICFVLKLSLANRPLDGLFKPSGFYKFGIVQKTPYIVTI
jgi:hypothetical protein